MTDTEWDYWSKQGLPTPPEHVEKMAAQLAAQLARIQELRETVPEFANALTLHKDKIAELTEEREQLKLEHERELARVRVETLELVRQDIRIRALDILHASKRELPSAAEPAQLPYDQMRAVRKAVLQRRIEQ
jgi:hypothetical protein